MSTQIKGIWDKANQDVLANKEHGDLFKPVDGDTDGNARLTKGFELVDKAFSENPHDPNLTPEQRASVVRRHAAVRMRAAAFGRLYAQHQVLLKKVEAMEKELSGYKASVPGTGGRTTTTTPPQQMKAWDSMRARLQKAAQH
jgi:hypothetical protein